MSRLALRTRRVVLAGASGLLAIAALAGCSSETAGDDTATPSSDVCADVDTAKTSLQALVDTKIAQEGTDTLRTRLETFESDVQTLVKSGQDEFGTETTAVKDSVATLKADLAGLREAPTAADLAEVRPSLQTVKTSTDDLITSVESTC